MEHHAGEQVSKPGSLSLLMEGARIQHQPIHQASTYLPMSDDLSVFYSIAEHLLGYTMRNTSYEVQKEQLPEEQSLSGHVAYLRLQVEQQIVLGLQLAQ